MIILIAGDTHTGKTLFAQRLLEKYKYPYLSIDHLKMRLIRSRDFCLNIHCSLFNDFLFTDFFTTFLNLKMTSFPL